MLCYLRKFTPSHFNHHRNRVQSFLFLKMKFFGITFTIMAASLITGAMAAINCDAAKKECQSDCRTSSIVSEGFIPEHKSLNSFFLIFSNSCLFILTMSIACLIGRLQMPCRRRLPMRVYLNEIEETRMSRCHQFLALKGTQSMDRIKGSRRLAIIMSRC